MAATTRTSTLIVCESPTLSNARACSPAAVWLAATYSSSPLHRGERAAIGLLEPAWRLARHVNSPRTCPNSSSSALVSGMALQLSDESWLREGGVMDAPFCHFLARSVSPAQHRVEVAGPRANQLEQLHHYGVRPMMP